MDRISRRAFFSVGAAGAAGAVSIPLLSEGYLAAQSLGRVSEAERSQLAWLNSNENPYGPCARAREAIERGTAAASRYPNDAHRQLAERLAKLHGVGEDMIVLGNGSSEVLRMAAGAFLKPGRTLVAPALTYESPARYALVCGAEVKTVPLTGDFRHDVKAMAAAAAGETGLIYACNPNNPTASITPKDDLAALVAAIPAGAALLVDEAYHHFVDSSAYESAIRYVQAGKDVVVSRTFSKIYGLAGLRIGYAVARRDLADRLRRQALHLNTNVLGLQAALASLDDADLVPQTRDRNARARAIVTGWLDQQSIRYAPSHANFLFFHTGREIGGLIGEMRRRGVVVGRPFPPMTEWMRLTVGTEDEMRRFLSAYKEVSRA